MRTAVNRCTATRRLQSSLILLLTLSLNSVVDASPRISSESNQFVVMEADSSAASRLEAQYPNRLRRVRSSPKALHLNNVAVLIGRPKVVPSPAIAPSAPTPSAVVVDDAQTECANRQVSTPTDQFIVVCVDSANHVTERDKRALVAFVDFASKESLALAVHVSGETEWDALQRVLGSTAGAVNGVRFREVRYGDGLSPGQIKIQRFNK
jgi:hypothetical protein